MWNIEVARMHIKITGYLKQVVYRVEAICIEMLIILKEEKWRNNVKFNKL